MRVLLFGAGGYLGKAIGRALQGHGHSVAALARDADSEARLNAQGIDPVRGDLDDLAALTRTIKEADGVIFAAAVPFDREWPVASAILEALKGSGKPFILTTGTAVLSHETHEGQWREESYAEDDAFTPPPWIATRVATEQRIRATDGVRAMIVRPPLIWGLGGSKQIPAIFDSVKKTGAACYIGAGLNLYTHVHVEDLAEVYCQALVNGKAGALYHAVAGEANWRSLAEAVGAVMGCPARSVTIDEAKEIWGDFVGPLFFGVSSRSRSPRTRSELSWQPRHLDVLADVRNGSYRDRYAPS
ncbi:2-alkyl-3-oxoalkanoate reductase [Alphaproteobacteria bacterium SO-S41]|nr:2-alkyl-3-oxoalkanoate reductase [Alphaproteobacteria bacterium SO-S41]